MADMAANREDMPHLGGLAQRAGQSKFRFHKRFRKFAGEPPSRYARRLRLERAAVLLASGDQTILSIALETGFASHEVSMRAFRRAFGCTPSRYRSRVQRQAHPISAKTAILVDSIGPCVRLFRIKSNSEQREYNMPIVEIRKKTLKSQPVLLMRRQVPGNQLQALFADCFPKLFQFCVGSGIAITGQPIARYVATGTGLWTIECAIPVAEPVSGEGEIEAGTLRAGCVAFAIHAGDYESLPETNAAIETWIEKNGFRRDGASWEQYITSPAEHPNVEDWRTHVCWPIAEASENGVNS